MNKWQRATEEGVGFHAVNKINLHLHFQSFQLTGRLFFTNLSCYHGQNDFRWSFGWVAKYIDNVKVWDRHTERKKWGEERERERVSRESPSQTSKTSKMRRRMDTKEIWYGFCVIDLPVKKWLMCPLVKQSQLVHGDHYYYYWRYYYYYYCDDCYSSQHWIDWIYRDLNR